MKRWILTLAVVLPLLLVACGNGGGSIPPVLTYYSTDTPLMIPDEGFIRSDILVTGGPTFISQVTVTVAIVHPSVSDLVLVLWSPTGGTSWIYLTQNDSEGEDFWYTTFTEDALVGIWETGLIHSPRTGSYQPLQRLDWFIGENANGFWTLDVVDNVVLDDGYLIEWSIDIQ